MAKRHINDIDITLRSYTKRRSLEFSQYSQYHMRVSDGGYIVLDVWTTGRYYILTTDYAEIAEGTIERGGEKGFLPTNNLDNFLDKIFYPEAP